MSYCQWSVQASRGSSTETRCYFENFFFCKNMEEGGEEGGGGGGQDNVLLPGQKFILQRNFCSWRRQLKVLKIHLIMEKIID
jgi:hypothetical protein